MLEGCPSPVLQRMLEQKAAVGIFGRDHVVSGEGCPSLCCSFPSACPSLSGEQGLCTACRG